MQATSTAAMIPWIHQSSTVAYSRGQESSTCYLGQRKSSHLVDISSYFHFPWVISCHLYYSANFHVRNIFSSQEARRFVTNSQHSKSSNIIVPYLRYPFQNIPTKLIKRMRYGRGSSAKFINWTEGQKVKLAYSAGAYPSRNFIRRPSMPEPSINDMDVKKMAMTVGPQTIRSTAWKRPINDISTRVQIEKAHHTSYNRHYHALNEHPLSRRILQRKLCFQKSVPCS